MKKLTLLVASVLAATTLSIGTYAQEMTKKDAPPKPAASPSQAVLDQWNDIGRKLIAMAEDFPEDKYDFKPAPSVRSFAERLIHAAHANYFFTNVVLGQQVPAMDDPKRKQYKTKAGVAAFVKPTIDPAATRFPCLASGDDRHEEWATT